MGNEWQQVEDKFKSLNISDSLEKIKALKHLKEIACSPSQKVKFIYSLLEEMLSEYPETCLGPMPIDMWEDSIDNALQMLDILLVNENIIFSFAYLPELYKNYYKGTEFHGQIQVPGDLASLAETFSFVFLSGLNQSDPLSAEYELRRMEEPRILLIFEKMIKYLEEKKDFKRASQVSKLVVNFLYHNPLSCRTLMENRVNLVYKYGNNEMKEFTMLRDIYHLALIDRFSDSLNMMIRFLNESKLNFLSQTCYHEGIARRDFHNQFHFNRAIAQLALSAFRVGRLAEARSLLAWLFVSGGEMLNQLLGQDCPYTPSYGRKILQVEESGRVPYHMQINVDSLETVYHICCQEEKDSKSLDQFSTMFGLSEDQIHTLGSPACCLRTTNAESSDKVYEGNELLQKERGYDPWG